MTILKLGMFFLAGILGILFHCFIEMGKINKRQNGSFSYKSYIEMERFNIISSVLCVLIAVICSSLVNSLMKADYYITPFYICVGYLGQSVLVSAFGKAADVIGGMTGHQIQVEQEVVQVKKTTITESGKPTVETKDESGITS